VSRQLDNLRVGKRHPLSGNDAVGPETFLAGDSLAINVEGHPRPPPGPIGFARECLDNDRIAPLLADGTLPLERFPHDVCFDDPLVIQSNVTKVCASHPILG
jgi:hypothetical protein